MKDSATGARTLRAVLLWTAAGLAACGGDEAGVPAATVLSPENSNHTYVSYAPDGRRVAYWAQAANGWDLTVAAADLSEPRVIASSPLETRDRAYWSPDGGAITYGSMAGGFLDIWLARAVGGEPPRRLTEGAGLELPFQWHPEGRQLTYFLTEEGGNIAVRLLDVATGASRPLPGTDAGDLRIGWWSPDGARIVYSVKDARGLWTIWLADSAGGSPRQLTTEGFEFVADRPWSPDGTELLYTSWRTGTADIYVWPVEGSEPRQLTRDVRADESPVWSPDGQWVAFQSNRGRQTDVWLVPAAGGTEVRVTDDAVEESDIQWIPGTTRLAFTKGTTARGLWTLTLTDGAELRLTPDSIRVGGWDLSRDRTQVVYEVQRGGGVTDLAIVPVAGGPPRTIVSSGAEHWQPGWSPDGSQVAFLSNRSGNVDAWVVDTAGGEPRQVSDWPTDEFNAEWTSDGSGLYVTSLRDADPLSDLWVFPLDGGEPRRLTTLGTLQGVLQSPVTADLFVMTFGGREGRWVLSRLRPDGSLETLWDRSNVMSIWSRGVTPTGDAILIDVQTESGGLSSVLIPLRGGEARQFLAEGETGSDWSADGTQLLYTIGATSPDIAVRSLRDSSTRRLTQTPDGEFNVRWTADGEHVVFVRETPRRAIVTVDVGTLIGR